MIVAALVAEAVVIALLAILVAGLLRSHADVLRALHDLGASLDDDAPARPREQAAATGTAGRDLAGVDATGATVGVSVRGGRDTLLVFLSTSCHTCQPFWQALRGGASAPANTNVLVVTRDDEPADRVAELAGDVVPVVMSTAAWADYEIPGSPHVVYVDGETGRVRGEGKAASWDRVLDLVASARAGATSVPPAGTSARQWLPPIDAPASQGFAQGDRAGGSPLRGDRDNAVRIDAELAAGGVDAGHPSLYPTAQP